MCALLPPFRADDMQGLYKAVVKGKYPRLPEHYSLEISKIVQFLLQTNSTMRPTCDQILSLPIVETLSKKFFNEE
jgi:NIMA (never in mitosis gene a)-related kinase